MCIRLLIAQAEKVNIGEGRFAKKLISLSSSFTTLDLESSMASLIFLETSKILSVLLKKTFAVLSTYFPSISFKTTKQSEKLFLASI